MKGAADAAPAELREHTEVRPPDRRHGIVDQVAVDADPGRSAVERREQVDVRGIALPPAEEDVHAERVVGLDPVAQVEPLAESLGRELLDLDHGSGPWNVSTR